jgi:hypothetical protein
MRISARQLLLPLALIAAASAVWADCKSDCGQSYEADLRACERMGDPTSKRNCHAWASDKLRSCANGCK